MEVQTKRTKKFELNILMKKWNKFPIADGYKLQKCLYKVSRNFCRIYSRFFRMFNRDFDQESEYNSLVFENCYLILTTSRMVFPYG